MYRTKLLLVFGVLLYSLALSANASPMPYTNYSSFLDNLPGAPTILDFESETPFATIDTGDTVGGIQFNHGLGAFGLAMEISTGFDTTSGANYLGTNDLGVFQDGDDFSLSLGPVNAIGMFFISADTVSDGEISLTAGGATANLLTADAGTPLNDGGVPYFLGIIDTMNAFDLALITTSGNPDPQLSPTDGWFLFNVDDIITAVVPLPGAVWLFVTGLIGLAAFRRKTS